MGRAIITAKTTTTTQPHNNNYHPFAAAAAALVAAGTTTAVLVAVAAADPGDDNGGGETRWTAATGTVMMTTNAEGAPPRARPPSVPDYDVDDKADTEDILSFYDLLLEQLVVVRYDEARDGRTITSDNGYSRATGLPGLACKHCSGHHGAAAAAAVDGAAPGGAAPVPPLPPLSLNPEACAFPQDRRTLAREFTGTLAGHLAVCPACPEGTRRELTAAAAGAGFTGGGTPRRRSSSSFSRDERLWFRDLWYRLGHPRRA